ncbi:MAG: heavy-metal-associated domain-containing protein [Microthrixaceae bacterium]
MPSEMTVEVLGMTCGHCEAAVKAEVATVEGVSDVEVNLETGAVRILSEAPIDPQLVSAAVQEAGYEVA